MSAVANRISECEAAFRAHHPTKTHYPLVNPRWLVWHKTSLRQRGPDNPRPVADQLLDGQTLCAVFARNSERPPTGLGTGGRPPYHVLIRGNSDATAEQILPLSLMAMHAGRQYNGRGIAFAAVGDFDLRPPSDAQWRRMVIITAAVLPLVPGGLEVVGHTDLPGASWDPSKRCPGRYVNLSALQDEAERLLPDGWRTWTPERGVLWVQCSGLSLPG